MIPMAEPPTSIAPPLDEGFWTETRVTLLTLMHEREVSFARIARKIGCTRSAAFRKARRLGLHRGEQQRLQALEAHNNEVRRAKLFVRPSTLLGARVWQATERSVALVRLEPNACRWPVGEATGAHQLFCGDPCDTGQTYCATCRQRNVERDAP